MSMPDLAADEYDAVMTCDEAPARPPVRSIAGLAFLAVLAAYVALMLFNFSPAIFEPDDNGYFAQGSLLVTTGHTWFRPASDAQYIGMHWLLTPGGEYVSRYPPGLAVLIGAVYALCGYKAAVLVNPMLSTLMLAGVYFLSRRLGLGRWWGVAAVLLLATNPTVLHHALSGDSHMGVTCALAWGVYFLLRWSREKRARLIFLAGLVLGTIPTIRYPDAIMAGGLVVFVLARRGCVPVFWKHLLAGAAGAAIPIVPLLVRNQLLLGGFWKTGYALTNEQTGFGWSYFTQHALQYVQQIHAGGVGLFFALGIVGFVCLLCGRPTRAVGAMFTLLALPMLLLYMAYYWAPGMSAATMRFLLPTFPAYVLAGVWALAALTRAAPRAARVAVPAVLMFVQLLWAASDATQQLQRMRGGKEPLAILTDAIDDVADQGDVVIADGQLLQHLDFVRHWKVADATLAGGVRGAGPGGGPMDGAPGGGGPGGPPMGGGGFGPAGNGVDQPSPMQAEKREAQRKLYPGPALSRQRKFAADVKAWARGQSIWLVGPEADVRQMLGGAIDKSELEIVRRLSIPSPRFGGPMGGFGAPPGAGMGNRQRGGPAGQNRGADREGRPAMVEYVIARWNVPTSGQAD